MSVDVAYPLVTQQLLQYDGNMLVYTCGSAKELQSKLDHRPHIMFNHENVVARTYQQSVPKR